MEFKISFSMWMDGIEEEITEKDIQNIKNFIFDNLDSGGISISNVKVELKEE